MNFISISGHLGHDASTRESKAGKPVISFSLSDQPYGKTAEGERLPAIWFDCTMFGERAEKLAPFLLKGKKVTVFGQLGVRNYTGRDGTPRTSLDVRVVDLALQDGKKEMKSAESKKSYADVKGHAMKKAAPAPQAALDDDDIPF